MSDSPSPRRLLLKLSGEALMGEGDFGIDPQILGRLAGDIAGLVRAGVQIGVVIGGGNIFRGAGLAGGGFDRVRGDQIGMLATVMNALAMQDRLGREGIEARTLSAFRIDTVCEHYSRDRAVAHLEAGRVVMLAGGTGNPFFTTDSAAALRAIEIGADLMIKATKVNGVYSADPVKVPDAEFYPRLSYDRVLAEGLGVMDATAVVLCKENGLPLRVMNINEPDALRRVVQGEPVGTLVTGDDA
ncbi:MAG TPA: UMP kinase [Gammaproteobacteria bacterium]|nr:UMP kinase [Gammaproteobacteria bacterium]